MRLHIESPIRDQSETQDSLIQAFAEIDRHLISQGLQRDLEYERISREHLSQYEEITTQKRAYCLEAPLTQVILAQGDEWNYVSVGLVDEFEANTERGKGLIEFLTTLCKSSGLHLAYIPGPTDELDE